MRVEVKKKPLVYAGRKYQVGDTLEMNAKHARLFTTLGQVKEEKGRDVSDDVEEAAEPAAPWEPIDKPKRAYRRRDMKAE